MLNKIIFIFLITAIHSVSFSQMKRSCYGNYQGKIESYSMGKINEQIQVEPTNIEVQLLKNKVFIFLGNQKYEGTWKVLLETKVYYLVETYTNSNAPERLMVYKNGRKILREGISPQPNVILDKKR